MILDLIQNPHYVIDIDTFEGLRNIVLTIIVFISILILGRNLSHTKNLIVLKAICLIAIISTGYDHVIDIINGTNNYLFELFPGQLFQESNVFDMLSEGAYELIISNPITGFDSTLYFVIDPSIIECLSCETSSMPFDCVDIINGSINVIPLGGIPQYSFSINGGQIQNISLFDNLNEGTYTFEVMDNSGQTANCFGEVELVNLPNIEYSELLCFGDANNGRQCN